MGKTDLPSLDSHHFTQFKDLLICFDVGVGFVPRQTDGADLQCGRDALAIPLSLFMQHDADEYYMARLGAIRSRNLLATFHEMKTNVYMHKKAGLDRLPTMKLGLPRSLHHSLHQSTNQMVRLNVN